VKQRQTPYSAFNKDGSAKEMNFARKQEAQMAASRRQQVAVSTSHHLYYPLLSSIIVE
jgi:hypothetical protein